MTFFHSFIRFNKSNNFKLVLIVFLFSFVISPAESKACHALGLVNPTVTVVSDGIELDASSDPATCGAGCANSIYWMDIEIRCITDNFTASVFQPGTYLNVFTYPFYQSSQMQKPNCILQPYPTTYVPFQELCPGDYHVRMRENHNGQFGPWTSALTFTVPPGGGSGPSLSSNILATKDTICEGECTTISASTNLGCTSNLQYNWSNGATTDEITVCPTQDAVYSVDMTGGCMGDSSATITIHVTPPANPGVASVSQNEVCEGETVEFSLIGYSDSIQWQAAPDISGPWTDLSGEINDTMISPPLDSTLTCFRAQVGTCGTLSLSNEICLTVKPSPIIEVNDLTICQEDTVDLLSTVSHSGGDYYWVNENSPDPHLTDISPIVTTDYTVNYNLNGCTDSHTSTVVVNIKPEALFDVNSVCYLDSVYMYNNSIPQAGSLGHIIGWFWEFGDGDNSSFWDAEHYYNQVGTYDVTLTVETNHGCLDSIVKQVDVYPLPTVSISAENIYFCEGDSVLLTVPNNGNSSQWLFNGSNINGANSSTYYAFDEGIYNLIQTTPNGCSDSSLTNIEVYYLPSDSCQTIGLSSFTDKENLKRIYPNPANTFVQVENKDADNYDIDLYDVNGKILYNKQNVADLLHKIDVSAYKIGMYFVKIKSDNNTYTKKLIIK